MRTRRQVTLHLDLDVADALDVEADRRGLNVSRAANDALRRALIDERDETLADTVKVRLDRLDKRDAARARDLAIIKEALLLYVRVYLDYAGPLEVHDDPDGEADAEARFEDFLQVLAEQMERPSASGRPATLDV
jgi:hypothetical protein